jgi:MYXO-CTERM domain-containing protein
MECICDRCEIPDCYAPGHECPAGRQCEDGTCVEDPCFDVSCAAPQFCRDGTCHDPCELEDLCDPGEVCFDGECVADPCWMVTCPNPGEECADGECTAACADVECSWPLECDPETGDCEEPACWDVRCPEGYDCAGGTCVERWHPADDSDAGDGGGEIGAGQQVLATGAGGCACRTTASAGATGGWLTILGLALAAFAARPRRRVR